MIAIIDYGAGNLQKRTKALTAIGEESIVTRDRHEILNADKVILPESELLEMQWIRLKIRAGQGDSRGL